MHNKFRYNDSGKSGLFGVFSDGEVVLFVTLWGDGSG